MDNRGQKILSILGITMQDAGSEQDQAKSQWRASCPKSILHFEAPQTENYEAAPIVESEEGLLKSNSSVLLALEMPNLNFVIETGEDLANELTDEIAAECDEHKSKNNVVHNDKVQGSSASSSSDFEEPYSSDDSVDDPNYLSDSSSSSSTSDNTSSHEVENLNTVEPVTKKKTRKRKAEPFAWKKNCIKRLRNSGKFYRTQAKGLEVPERKLQPPCDETKCRQKCSTKFTLEERQIIFQNYWEIADIVKQRTYILTLMQEVNPKYRYTREGGGRAINHAFYFPKNGKKIRVCKSFFISTLGITNRCIRTVKEKIENGTLEEDNRGTHDNHQEVPKEIKDGVRHHISSIPTIESHYTRAHSEKVYIEGGKTIAQLYRDYKSECESQKKPFATLTMYRNIFNSEFNIAFFVPKKDQCQTCTTFENASEEEKEGLHVEYTSHMNEKKWSREEKENDKKNISQSYQVACFDLQAALPTPAGQVSSFYYKSKLSTYNFTVCDLTKKGQGSVNCYMWHEGEGKRGAVEIGTCLLHYLKEKAETSNTDNLEIVFYSDNCAGQQKNKYILAAYLYAVANYKIKSITHKYLVTGHTQNEGDCVHSMIEKNIKRALKSGPIYTPSQYVTLVRTAKKTGKPFNVIEMTHDDFLDLKQLTEKTFNFNTNDMGEDKFSQVSIFMVEKKKLNSFFYKTSFNDTKFKEIKLKEKRTRASLTPLSGFQLVKAYDRKIPVSKKKYDDLMFLLKTNAIIKSHSHFYNALSFE